MGICIRQIGAQQAAEVLRIMRLAFEEYRGRLVPSSGALAETIEGVRAVTNAGSALLWSGPRLRHGIHAR
jgi:hypothetical protein